MLTFLCRDRPVYDLSPSRSFERRHPCDPYIPRIQSSFSVPNRSLIYDRFKVFLKRP